MRKQAVISTGPHANPRWLLGLYVPHDTRWPVGVHVERGHFSAGIRGLVGFYIQDAGDPRERRLLRKKSGLISGKNRRSLNESEMARVLGDAR